MSLARNMRRMSNKPRLGGNNRSNKLGGRNNGIRKQLIYDSPYRILVSRTLTKKGERLFKEGAPESVLGKYRINHYRIFKDARVVKTIYHQN